MIGFHPDLIPLILSGKKTLTYRLGDKFSSLQVGDEIEVRNSQTGEVLGVVEISSKSTVSFKDLPINRSGHEVYPTKEEQRKTFEQYYKRKVDDNENVIVLQFRLKKS